MKQLVAVAAFAFALFACGKGNPVGPDGPNAPAPAKASALTVVAMRTGLPVPGAQVKVVRSLSDIRPLGTTDGGGYVSLDGAQVGQTIRIEAGGFLSRHFIASSAPVIMRLWEGDAQLTTDFTEELVYGYNQGGTRALQRPTAPVLTVQPTPQMWSQRRVAGALPNAIDVINEVVSVPNGTTFVLDLSGGPAAFPVAVSLDPGDPDNPGELTWAYPRGAGEIFKCDIKLEGTEGFWGLHLQRVFEHAFTHCLGLIHAPGYGGIMGDQGPAELSFGAMERQVMRNIFWRLPGNRAPDVAGEVPASIASVGTTAPVVCKYPMPK